MGIQTDRSDGGSINPFLSFHVLRCSTALQFPQIFHIRATVGTFDRFEMEAVILDSWLIEDAEEIGPPLFTRGAGESRFAPKRARSDFVAAVVIENEGEASAEIGLIAEGGFDIAGSRLGEEIADVIEERLIVEHRRNHREGEADHGFGMLTELNREGFRRNQGTNLGVRVPNSAGGMGGLRVCLRVELGVATIAPSAEEAWT